MSGIPAGTLGAGSYVPVSDSMDSDCGLGGLHTTSVDVVCNSMAFTAFCMTGMSCVAPQRISII